MCPQGVPGFFYLKSITRMIYICQNKSVHKQHSAGRFMRPGRYTTNMLTEMGRAYLLNLIC